jgi:hypothetical protein
VLAGMVRGGVLVEPPLIEKGGVTKNDFYTGERMFPNWCRINLIESCKE